MSPAAPGSAPGSSDCRERALKLLARRPHFRLELSRKLAARGFEPTEVDAVCDRLEELGLLDDAEAARLGVAGRRRRGDGPLKIRAGLQRRGAGELADSLLAADAEEQVAGARAVAERWLARHRWERERLGRHLQGKGWPEGTILTVLERLEPGVEAGKSR